MTDKFPKPPKVRPKEDAEARISETARSAGWIKTEYVNQTSSTFFTVGLGSSNARSTYLKWDHLNRVTQVTATGTTTSTYAYDPWGERVKVTLTTSTAVSIYYESSRKSL